MNTSQKFDFNHDTDYFDLIHIIQQWKILKTLEISDPKSEEYIKQNKVGFEATDKYLKFTSTKRHFLNNDWKLNYHEITGIAFGNRLVIGDDELFMIFFQRNSKPVYFTMPAITSEEMEGIDIFINKLKEEIDFQPIKWQQDKIILTHPKNLKGKELYENWFASVNSFLNRIGRAIGIQHEYSGIIKKHLIQELEKIK